MRSLLLFPFTFLFVLVACGLPAERTTTESTQNLASVLTSTSTPIDAPVLTSTVSASPVPTNWPLPQGTTFTFGDDVNSSDQALITRGITLANDYFQQRGYTAGPVEIYTYSNKADILSVYDSHLQNYTPSPDGIWLSGGAETRRGLIVFATTGFWGRYQDGDRFRYRITFHEYTHTVQNYLYGRDITTGNKVPRAGPVWIIEGCAQYIATKIADSQGLYDYEKELRSALDIAASSASLSSYESWGSIRKIVSNPYDIGLAACDYLSKQKGESALFDFWRLQAEGQSWQQAFLSAFGLSISDFYKQFDSYSGAGGSDPVDSSACISPSASDGDLTITCIGYLPHAKIPNQSGRDIYAFRVSGSNLPSDLSGTLQYPSDTINGHGQMDVGIVFMSMSPLKPTGIYQFTLTLADGRSVTMSFMHKGK